MRGRTVMSCVAIMLGGASSAAAADEPLSACFDAVGTFLTTNTDVASGEVVARGLISLTNGGHFFRTDSNEGGIDGFAPFTETRGAWRCTSDDDGTLHILATALDFSHKTAKYPEQTMGRLDFDAVYNEQSDSISGEMDLYFVPIDADPMDGAMLKDGLRFTFESIRVTAQ